MMIQAFQGIDQTFQGVAFTDQNSKAAAFLVEPDNWYGFVAHQLPTGHWAPDRLATDDERQRLVALGAIAPAPLPGAESPP